MVITRDSVSGTELQRMIVPISYGPFQKFLAKITQDPNLDMKQAVSLPRMSFEISSMSYDPQRNIAAVSNMRLSGESEGDFVYVPAPYNLEINLYIMTKYTEDGTKILEQILPFFKPDYTFSAKIIDDLPPLDLPLVLTSISTEDMYEGDFETRRALMWTLSFTLKGWFFGPVREKRIIKFIDNRIYSSLETGDGYTSIEIQPGLTAQGEPTENLNETVPFTAIDFGDDWGVITMIEDVEPEND